MRVLDIPIQEKTEGDGGPWSLLGIQLSIRAVSKDCNLGLVRV